jgi:hypothetical protein
MPQYKFFNGPMPTTAAQLAVTTGTSIKTLLQVKGVTAVQFKVVAWGISFDGAAAAAGIQAELCETGTVFGTVTAAAAADLSKWDDPNAPTPSTFFSLGTSATGYTCTSEGSITAVRMFDSQLIQPTNQYVYEFSLGREPKVDAVSALRVRVKAAAAVNALAWVLLEV